MFRFVSIDPNADYSGGSGKEPTKKSKSKGKGEAVSQRLLAAAHKVKHVFVSG